MTDPEEWHYDERVEMLRLLRERISTETDPEKLKLKTTRSLIARTMPFKSKAQRRKFALGHSVDQIYGKGVLRRLLF